MAKTCGLCGYAASDQAAFDEHTRGQHQWEQVARAASRPMNPGIAALVAALALMWLIFGIAILLPVYLARRDGGLDLRKADHAIAVLMVPVVFILQWVLWPMGPFVLPSVWPPARCRWRLSGTRVVGYGGRSGGPGWSRAFRARRSCVSGKAGAAARSGRVHPREHGHARDGRDRHASTVRRAVHDRVR